MSYSVKKVFFRDYLFNVWGNVYEPAEDSFLFAENLTLEKGEGVLDMGTGCGILGIVAADKASRVVAVDINPYAVRCAKENARLNGVANKMFLIQGDLFAPIKAGEKFDVILFNTPYLPIDLSEGQNWIEKAWAGGTNGRAVLDRFLNDFPVYLKDDGRVLLMQSTLANVDKTLKIFAAKGFKTRVVAKRDLPFFETIMLIEAKH
ncbi:MAG: class I SAM-dependent methyltransferase [Nitrososphaerota archaeon]|nr:class I SAM-dependent methyltransferase [Candidatus Bathyarchaeota archaeon]MDW8023812.1 class I SAM-dependent methyltransferase [Nitrososphaerota archaeon]